MLCQAAAASAGPLTIEQAIARAEQRTPQIRAAQARVDQAVARRRAAGYLMPSNPELDTSYQSNKLIDSAGESNLEIGLQQQLEIFGQRGLRIDVADADSAGAKQELEAARLSIRAEVALAYYELMYQDRRSVAAKTVVAQAERLAEAARRRVAAGDLPEAEYSLVLADLAQAQSDQDDVAAERDVARARLNVLVGVPAIEPTSTVGDFPSGPAGVDGASAARARDTGPLLRASVAEIAARTNEVSLRRRERWPNPTLGLFYSREQRAYDLDNFAPNVVKSVSQLDHFFGVRLSFALPVFRTGSAEIAAARAGRAEAEARRDGIAARLDIELATARARYQSATRQVARYGALGPRLADALALYEKAYAAGQFDLTQFLSIRDRLLRAAAAALKAHRDAAVAGIELVRASQGVLAGGAR